METVETPLDPPLADSIHYPFDRARLAVLDNPWISSLQLDAIKLVVDYGKLITPTHLDPTVSSI